MFLSLQALLQTLQRNTYIAVFNSQNRVTFCQIVTQLVCTTQGTTNLIQKTCPTSRKSCHVFPKSRHDWAPRKHALSTTKIMTRWWNRVTISLFLQITNWSQIQHSPPWLLIWWCCRFNHQPPCYSLQKGITLQQTWSSPSNVWTLI